MKKLVAILWLALLLALTGGFFLAPSQPSSPFSDTLIGLLNSPLGFLASLSSIVVAAILVLHRELLAFPLFFTGILLLFSGEMVENIYADPVKKAQVEIVEIQPVTKLKETVEADSKNNEAVVLQQSINRATENVFLVWMSLTIVLISILLIAFIVFMKNVARNQNMARQRMFPFPQEDRSALDVSNRPLQEPDTQEREHRPARKGHRKVILD